MKFLADARMQQGDKFNLRAFHDFVWKNGNVPIALQEWEYLGETVGVSGLHLGKVRFPRGCGNQIAAPSASAIREIHAICGGP